MEELKCVSCGGKVDINEELMIGVCEYCGSQQPLPEEILADLEYEQNQKRYSRKQRQQKRNKISLIISVSIIAIIFILCIIRSSVIYIDDIQLAKNFNVNNKPTEYVKCYYMPVEQLILTGYIENAKESIPIKLVWKRNGEIIAQTEPYVQYYSVGYFYSIVSNDQTWSEGDYSVEIYLKNQGVRSKVFNFKIYGY